MKNYLLLIFALLHSSAKAQIQFKSLDEVFRYADTHAVAIKNAEISEQIALSEKKEARSYLLPTINGSLGYNDNLTLQPTLVPNQLFNPDAPENSYQELTFGTKYQYTRGIQAQWDILNFQKMFAVKTANIQLEASRVNVEVNRYQTYNQLASTYYSILLTQESIRIYEQNVETSASILEHSTNKFNRGLISRPELNRVEIKHIQNQRSLQTAESNLDQFYLQFQSQLNTDQNIVVTDTPDQFQLKEKMIRTLHPEVMLQELEVKKTEALLKQAQAQKIPTLSLLYQHNQTWAADDFLNFTDANKLPQQSFGLKLDLSGLLHLSTRQKIKQSKWQLELQEQQLENTRLVKGKEDELLHLQLEQTSAQLSENRRIIALQEENDIHTENQYQGGIISLDQRLDRYDDLLVAQDSYLQSLAAYTLAQYKVYIRQI